MTFSTCTSQKVGQLCKKSINLRLVDLWHLCADQAECIVMLAFNIRGVSSACVKESYTYASTSAVGGGAAGVASTRAIGGGAAGVASTSLYLRF